MANNISDSEWSANWSVPEAAAADLRRTVQQELFHAWNSPRTTPDTGRIYVSQQHLTKPGETGVYLLEAMKVDLTPLPKEEQFLIASTSCQHRIEWIDGVMDPLTGMPPDWIPRLVYYDGRAMYLGCCQGIGIAGGKFKRSEGEDIREDERGRARVRFNAPDGWRHVGLLPVKDDAQGWRWPITYAPWHHETWADLCEIRFARSMGWSVEVLEKITWPEARPLDLWAQRLSRLYLQHKGAGNDLLASCYRSIALHTIGRLHNLGYRDDRRVVGADDPRATFDAIESVGPDGVTVRTRERVDKPEHQCHPEWSAAIWAKTHLRVAKALMNVPRESVLAVRGDAVYLTEMPTWAGGLMPAEGFCDDGKAGRLRLKGQWPGPLPAPRNWQDLKALTSG
jgi:hypothetical protein